MPLILLQGSFVPLCERFFVSHEATKITEKTFKTLSSTENSESTDKTKNLMVKNRFKTFVFVKALTQRPFCFFDFQPYSLCL